MGRVIHSASDSESTIPDLLPRIRDLVLRDRDILEKGTKAFTSYARAYKEQHCAFIFRYVSRKTSLLKTKAMGSYNIRGYRVMFEGETAHIGPTPMDRRHNALTGAGYMIGKVNDIGLKYAATNGKTTCAKIDVWPNIYGILPSEVELTIDYRHADMETLAQMKAELDAALVESCTRAQVTSRITKTWKFGDDGFDPELCDMMRAIVPGITERHKEMLGQAGHDAYSMASFGVPTVMIFTPCIDGITHNTAEDVDWERTIPGLNLMLNLVEQRANRPAP